MKNPTASAGFEPANFGTKASMLPLDHRSLCTFLVISPSFLLGNGLFREICREDHDTHILRKM